VGTTGLAAPTSTLTTCAADNLCGAGSFYNDCLIEIQSLDSAWGERHGLHPDLLRWVAWPGAIFPLPDETVAVEARSFPRQHAWLGGIDFGYEHPFDELIYLPAVENHLRQVLQSLGGYHDALACFGALGVGILR
jgi:hypothetical protein